MFRRRRPPDEPNVTDMLTTPASLFATAADAQARGDALPAILQTLKADGATDVDLIRIVKHLYTVRLGDALRLICEAGLPRFLEPFTVVIPEDDPWFDQLQGPDLGPAGTVLPS